MNRLAWLRMVASIVVALLVAGWIYETHPGWFRNHSSFTMPLLVSRPTAVRSVHAQRSATPAVPRVVTTQHLDGIWITPMRITASLGADAILPNIGDQFLI